MEPSESCWSFYMTSPSSSVITTTVSAMSFLQIASRWGTWSCPPSPGTCDYPTPLRPTWRSNYYLRFQLHPGRCPTTQPCSSRISRRNWTLIWRIGPRWLFFRMSEVTCKWPMGNPVGIGTISNPSTHLLCMWAPRLSNICGPKEWHLPWAPSLIVHTWIFSRI